jgi:TonB family protein
LKKMGMYSMVSWIKPLVGLVVGLFLTLQLQALEVKGIASYKALGVEYYIASLYLQDGAYSSKELLSYDGWQRIKIKVTAKRWSARKWKAQWQNNIAINNPTSDLASLNRDLAHFTVFPKSRFLPGDEIVIEYLPNQGSLVTFNSHQVLSTPDKQFYNYILNTWLGKFSPNRIFREKISGIQVPQIGLVSISSEPVSSSRIEAVQKWFLSDEEKRLAKLKKEREANAQQQQIANEKKREQDKKEYLLAIELEIKNKVKAKVQAAKKLKLEKKRLALKEAEMKQLKILNEQKYFHQLYQWNIRSRVNETVAYPPRAKQLNEQGTVKINFKVDRSGVITNLESVGEEISSILQQEVEKSLKLAIEIIDLPKNLKGDSWSFSLRYVFDLKLAEQEELLKPLKPF